jgi:hypothetical protein
MLLSRHLLVDAQGSKLTTCAATSKTWYSLNRSWFWLAVASCVITIGSYLSSFSVQPRVTRAELVPSIPSEGNQKRDVKYPFSEDLRDQSFTGVLELAVTVTALRATKYQVLVDDCVDWIEVNGFRIQSALMPHCNYRTPIDVALGDHLRTGPNVVKLGYRNFGGLGQLRLKVAPDEPYLRYLHSLELLGLVAFFLCVTTFLVKQIKMGPWFAVPFLLGSALRIFYVVVTPLDVRGHDWTGHAEYIQKFAETFTIPKSNEGWQGYQPPLYYLVSALAYRCAMLFGADSRDALEAVQLLSLAMSIGLLYLSMVVLARLSFRGSKKVGAFLASLVVAVLPSLVMAAARINNDALAQLLVLSAFAGLNSWWSTGAATAWYGSILALCLALLTKATALTLAPVYGFCLLFSRHTRFRDKCVLAIGAAAIIYVLIGWYVVFRVYNDGQRHLVGNASNISSALAIQTNPSTLITFNPLEVLKHPYNNPWSDTERRSFFWEYVVRGSLFGEFDFGPVFRPYAQWLLLLFMLLCVFAVAGYCVSLNAASVPVGLLFLFQLVGLIASRTQFPYSCSQDVRYILVAAVPFAFYIGQGCTAFSRRWQYAGVLFVLPFVGLCSYLVYFLFFS